MSLPGSLQGISVKDVAALAVDAAGLEPIELTIAGPNVPLISLKGQIQSLESYLSNPSRIRFKQSVSDIDSFIRYVNLHKQDSTAIWAHEGTASLCAVIDEHRGYSLGELPEWRDHQLTLVLQKDPDWEAWIDANGVLQSQDQFADRLRDLGRTIASPDAAKVADIVRKFEATRVSSFSRPVFDEVSGSVKIAYEDDVQQKGDFKLPSEMMIEVPVYKGGMVENLVGSLRWRFSNGGCSFGVQFIRPDLVEQAAFRTVCSYVFEHTNIEPYLT